MRAMPWLQSPQRLKGGGGSRDEGEAEPAVGGGVALLVGILEGWEAPAEERAAGGRVRGVGRWAGCPDASPRRPLMPRSNDNVGSVAAALHRPVNTEEACQIAVERCRQELPQLRECEPGHSSAASGSFSSAGDSRGQACTSRPSYGSATPRPTRASSDTRMSRASSSTTRDVRWKCLMSLPSWRRHARFARARCLSRSRGPAPSIRSPLSRFPSFACQAGGTEWCSTMYSALSWTLLDRLAGEPAHEFHRAPGEQRGHDGHDGDDREQPEERHGRAPVTRRPRAGP